MQKTILSIDCGTQSLRTIIFSTQGEILALEKIPFEPYVSRNPGWAEQDAEIYWNALVKGCNLLKENNPKHFDAIAGIGITTIRNSMVNVDKAGNPLRTMMTWLDQRKAKPVYKPSFFMKIAVKVIGMEDAIDMIQREGKCNWIRQKQPDIWDKTHKYLQVSGFLNYRLTGEFKDSVASQIGHIPFDYKRQKWGSRRNPFTFSVKTFPVEKEKLAKLVKPGEIIGTVTKGVSGETGLKTGLPVIACGSDKGCGTLGSGVLSEERASLSFGTTATIQTTSTRYLEPIRFMPSYPSAIPGFFNPEIEVFRGFWMITWFKNQFAQKELKDATIKKVPTEELLNELLKQTQPGSMGLVLQPFWSPGLTKPEAKGAMIGFGDVHNRAHIYRSIIEGLAFALLDGKHKIEKASGTKMNKLVVSGGASKSDEICQIAADIFNRTIIRGKTTETSGLGAAVITAFGIGLFTTVEEATKKMVHYEREFNPNKQNVLLYQKLYKKVYRKMYKKLKPLYQSIRDITGYPE